MPKGDPASAACVFFLFLLLTPVSPQCRTATADECKKSREFIPGRDLASRGFDITRLEHSQYNVFDFSEWKNQDGSCTLCENPLLQGKPLQRLPLAITDWKANISCQQKVQYSVALSCISLANLMTELIVRSDWKKELDVDVDPSTYTQFAAEGSIAKWVSFCRQKIEEDKYIFLLHHVSCSYYKFRISKNKSVSAKFMNNVKILPEKLDSHSKWGYNQLILRYGTHFMKEPDLGARVNYMTGIEACRIPLTNYTISEIRRCLEIEAGVHIGFDEMTKNPDFHKCKHKRTDMAFLFLVSKYIKDLEGGRTSNSDLSDEAFNFPESSKRWLESVKTLPALLSASIEPLHTLLDKNDPRRENLRRVVSEHVRRQVLLRNCTLPCPPGVQQSVWEPCSCECPNNNFTNTMCCSQQQGLGKLTMTIQRAESLWGDFFTHSDGYVSVSLQNKEMCTHTVWNNNNPEWNTSMDFGIVKLTGDFTKVKIEVWDEDSGWNDDLLGRCLMTLRPWETFQHVCRLNHGSLHYQGRLVCGYHLGGPSCRDYIPLWPKERKKNSQHMGKAER